MKHFLLLNIFYSLSAAAAVTALSIWSNQTQPEEAEETLHAKEEVLGKDITH